MFKGRPKDSVSFDSVAEIGESILHHVDKAGQILTAVTDQEEMEIGDRIHEEVRKRYRVKHTEDTPLNEYINEVGGKVAQAAVATEGHEAGGAGVIVSNELDHNSLSRQIPRQAAGHPIKGIITNNRIECNLLSRHSSGRCQQQ